MFELYSQSDLYSIQIVNENRNPIKNVNIQLVDNDTIYVTDTTGIIKISSKLLKNIKIKKYGYNSISINSINSDTTIIFEKDTSSLCKKIKYVDYKFIGNNRDILIKLNICNDTFLYYGRVYLANGKEIENNNEYCEIFQNHEIEQTYSFDVVNCKPIIKIRHENYKTQVLLIYYDDKIKDKKTKYIPSLVWKSKRKFKKDMKIMNLKFECPCD